MTRSGLTYEKAINIANGPHTVIIHIRLDITFNLVDFQRLTLARVLTIGLIGIGQITRVASRRSAATGSNHDSIAIPQNFLYKEHQETKVVTINTTELNKKLEFTSTMAYSDQEVHFLMVTAAMQGHLNPMLKLAKRLVSKGIHITIATNDIARHHMLNSKFSTSTDPNPNPKPPGISLVFFSDGLSPEFDRHEDPDTFIKSMRTNGRKNLSNLIQDLTFQGKKFSCIIFNPFFPWVAEIGAENSIPCATLWIQACTVYSVYYHFLKNSNLFPSLENANSSVELPGLPVLQVKDLPSFILPSSPPIFYETISQLIEKLDEVKWVLCNSFTEFENEVVKSMDSLHSILPIGPLVSPFLLGEETNNNTIENVDMWSAENSCMEWLDTNPNSSVIYISFGSITVLSQTQVDNLAMALKNSNKPFLWVIKPNPKSKSSENKGGELPVSFLEDTKGKGLVVTWCEQEKVLMHKAVGCFMTHCGWNSVLEAVVAGVPVIAYPGWTDQPTVAKLLVDVLKIGVRVKTEDGVASPKEIERCIVEIGDGLEAEEMKKRAFELKEAATKVVAVGGSSDRNINQFISEVTGKPF
ncbi:UDP-glycosyltransferase 84B2-like [Mercurialis annua]|uniref:UDP-glycosyltransferase 84B2-like n=1 Tax=Mercurialis annua TaxID=3986 RepID=UPI00215FF5D4|nr:UDP-glycosyltransferase 84B2-like [Mercurialis annua]